MIRAEFQCLFATAGKPSLGLYVTVAAGVTNMVLDALFVAVFRWGIPGAAGATAISQCVGGVIPLIYFACPNKSLLKIGRTQFLGRELLKACGNGSSELMSNISMSIVSMLYNVQLLNPKGRSDGGYAVSDFRKVQPSLGTMEDLEALADACRRRGMSLCLDFVMNHTSEDHAWAKRARAGEAEYRDRYFFYDSWDIPREFEKTVPQVFPTTAPGSFTELPEGSVVMTNFYPYQWDLNYANPAVFRDMTENLLYLANRGIDVIRLDAIPYIWKELGTGCRNLPQVHTLSRMLRMVTEIACPGVLLLGEVVMEPVNKE